MNRLVLENFKAFRSRIEIPFDGKNAIIYGENGGGKSSIYDAIKLWFHTPTVFDERCDKGLTIPTDIARNKNDILDSYNHQLARTTRFVMQVNGTAYNHINTHPAYDIIMLSREDLEVKDQINVVDTIKSSLVGIADPEQFVTDNHADLEAFINEVVQKDFGEKYITVSLYRNGTNWLINVEDTKRGIVRNKELTRYFNEGKLHIILLVLLLSAAQLNGSTAPHKILVLDDVITSLDTANRTFLIKYIHEYCNSYQKIIMTHSVSFYNQLCYSFRTAWVEKDSWKAIRVIQKEETSDVLMIDEIKKASVLRKEYILGTKPGHSLPASLPNDIRKRFEFLVSEISHLLTVGGFAESGQVLAEINDNKDIYFVYDVASKKTLNIYDMVNEMVDKITIAPGSPLKTDLETIFNRYKSGYDLDHIKMTLQLLMIYQKVVLHSGSHLASPIAPFSPSEIDKSIMLLQQLEKLMGKLIGRDMYDF